MSDMQLSGATSTCGGLYSQLTVVPPIFQLQPRKLLLVSCEPEKQHYPLCAYPFTCPVNLDLPDVDEKH